MPNQNYRDYSLVLESNLGPTAIIVPNEQEVVVSSIVKLDGTTSSSAQDVPLIFTWTFVQVPIGSQVASFGFTDLEDDSSIVTFAPDITGTYTVQLVVSDGTLVSAPYTAVVDVKALLVPQNQGIVPDASFIWNYLSDFWTLVPDRNRFETFWSAAIQVTAGEMLKLYQYQYNQSIRDIQDTLQKKWIAYSPYLTLDRTTVSFIMADDIAGTDADTFVLDPNTGLPIAGQPTYSNAMIVPLTDGNVAQMDYTLPPSVGRLFTMGTRSYTLARTGTISQSLNYGLDGSSSGSNVFNGSQFTSDMVGATLRVLAPSNSPLLADYVIASYISPTQVTVQTTPPGITWAGFSNITYTVLPATPQCTVAYADQVQVPTGLQNQPWRMSATLVSSTVNFEDEGVSPGDVLQIEITRIDIQAISNFFAQVVSVDRNRLGFVLNLTDLQPGVAGGGLTDDIQVTLASDLIVVGLSMNEDGSLNYSFDAASINNTVNSIAFKRAFYEQPLMYNSPINIGPFSIYARPVQVIRNSKIAVDPTVLSVPILQEYIKQPDIATDPVTGALTIMTNGQTVSVSRAPYLLSENLDYIIDDESMINGFCQVQQNDDQIIIPLGDLIDRSVEMGDTITVTIGITTETFDIREVVAADTLRVFPIPTLTQASAAFTITRRIAGNYIRFIDSTFSLTNPAPKRLWAEVSYIDNGDAIEGNFGILVGVTREDLSSVGSGIPYKSAVAGLMYALANGPTISNLGLSAQILTGLPFAQNAGVITEIDDPFRLRPDGSPLYARMLISATDNSGNPLGITNIYLIPEGRQIQDSVTGDWEAAVPDFSGIAINPATNIEYAVGDTVTQFAPLSKGIQIQEYLTTPTWIDNLVAQGNISALLTQYHAFEVLVNADLVSSVDIDLVAQFMLRVKAHYVKLTSGLLEFLEDNETITDDLSFGRFLDFYDASDLGMPSAIMVDPLDDDLSFISVDGIMYSHYHDGTDLATTYSSSTVSSASGGFVNPRFAFTESWDPPLIRPGDLLKITTGSNQGSFTITTVTNDTSVVLNLNGRTFATATGQSFDVYRPIQNPIFIGKVAITNGNPSVPITELTGGAAGIRAAGVEVGDILVFADLTTLNSTVSARYVINEVNPGVSPTINLLSNPSESSGTYTAWIIREQLIPGGIMTPPGSTGEKFYVNTTATQSFINFFDTSGHLNSWLNLAMMLPGDTVTIGNLVYTVMRFSPSTRQALVTPPLFTSETGTQVTVTLRPNRGSTPISVDFIDRLPSDYLQLEIDASTTTGDKANTINTSATVSLTVQTPTTIGALPGDALVILEGPDSTRDVGSGDGVFPIFQIISGGTEFLLMDELSSTGTYRYGLQRRLSNEG